MDLETVFLVSGLIAAWAGSVAAIMHMIGYIPPRYRTQLAAIQSTTAAAIGQELRAVFSEQEAKLAEAAEQAEDALDPLLPKLDELPGRIGQELEGALNRVADKQKAEMAEAERAFMESQQAVAKSAEMSVVRAVGVDKQAHARVDRLLGEAILGPAMPLLRQFAPGLADALDENPQLIDVVIQNPLFRKYVAPRVERYLGAMGSQNPEPAGGGGWGT